MDVLKADIIERDDQHLLLVHDGAKEIIIPLSEDKPNAVKEAFGHLITRLRDGLFQISLESEGEDLFSQVGHEYLVQLNREIEEIHHEMTDRDLMHDEEEE